MAEAHILNGKALAAQLVQAVTDTVTTLQRTERLTPGLAVVLVGEDPASAVYVRNKARQTQAAGMASFVHRLPATVSTQAVLTQIAGLNGDDRVHGVLVQLPLPPQIDTPQVLAAVDPAKDVDGFHVVNVGRFVTGAPNAVVPCTPYGCLRLIKTVREDLGGLHAVVVGRSNIVGKPMAHLLLQENCTVTVAHSRTRDLADVCRQADILVAAVGRPNMIPGAWIRRGAIVVDVGINRVDVAGGGTKLVGDVNFAEACRVADAVTPVPGGVGPMTVACLLRNTVLAACRQRDLDPPAL